MSVETRDSHPYFKTTTWKSGELTYRKENFHHIQMIYNIERDALIIKRADDKAMHVQPLELVSSEVAYFRIGESEFVFIDHDVDPFTTGFFEVLYSGRHMDLLAKRSKKFQIDDESKLAYLKADKYYLKKKGKYYRVRSLATIKSLLKDQKKGIKTFVKNNGVKILKPGSDDLFALLIAQCDDNMIE